MGGINRFRGLGRVAAAASATSGSCVFISYRHEDMDAASKVVTYLEDDCGVDVYFDQGDAELAAATANDNDQAIVDFIQAGIRASTHLLGIVSARTERSWWVPFEIGSGVQAQKRFAYLLLDRVDNLPAYLKIAELLPDRLRLEQWAQTKLTGNSLRKMFATAVGIPRLPDRRVEAVRFRR